MIDLDADLEDNDISQSRGFVYDPKIRVGDMAEKLKAEPPIGDLEMHTHHNASAASADIPVSSRGISHYENHEDMIDDATADRTALEKAHEPSNAPEEDDEMLDWSESENEGPQAPKVQVEGEDGTIDRINHSRSPSIEFEDVGIPDKPSSYRENVDTSTRVSPDAGRVVPVSGLVKQDFMADDLEQRGF